MKTTLYQREDLQGLISKIMPASGSCDVQGYVNGDVDLVTCNDMQDKM